MRMQIIIAGKPALAYAKSGVDEYLRRLGRFGRHEIISIKAGSSDDVSARLLERSVGTYRIALDERGEALSSRQFTLLLDELAGRGEVKCVSFLIGAADGHNSALRKMADRVISLSSLTLQHELALLVLMEQLYRAASLRQGMPYHRD